MSPRRAYAVSWREEDGPFEVGKLELGRSRVRFDGRRRSRAASYATIAGVASTRLNGHRATLVVLGDRTRVTLTSLDGPGALGELEHELRARVVAAMCGEVRTADREPADAVVACARDAPRYRETGGAR